jgi:hypothetical protein
MPLHIFLSQSLSLVTGGLEVWKLAKDILLLVVVMFTFCLIIQQRCTSRNFRVVCWLAGGYAALHLLLWVLHPAIYRDSAILGIIYNNRVFGYLVLGIGAALLLPAKFKSLTTLSKVVIGMSTLVALLGVLQYFLPKDILTHFGYGLDRGTLPAFFIDDKPNFPRIMSTLRDPNSLGAYLIMPLTWLAALLLRARINSRRLLLAGLLGTHLLAVFLTFSRGAWAATLLALGLLLVWQYAAFIKVFVRRFWPVLAVLCVLGLGGLFMARDTYVFKSYITHSTGKPKAAYDSNGFHWVFARRGLDGIVRNPFGHGPGTAGLASIQNPTGSFLTENYYIQIGYEVGVLGLLLFIAINVVVYVALLRQRSTPLAAVLLVSFWAYVLMNMLFHMWSNEAVAAQWWLLAGLVVGGFAAPQKSKKKSKTV